MFRTITSFLVIFSLFLIHPYAQPNALIAGKILDRGVANTIDLTVNQKYLNNNLTVYTSDVGADGGFAFPVEISEPTLVSLAYGRDKALLYLEPFDTLIVEAYASNFPGAVQFKGPSGLENELLYEHFENYPPALSLFQMTQYRYGTIWYTNRPEMDRWMIQYDRPTFVKKMDLKREDALQTFSVQANLNDGATAYFKDFLEANIIYENAYHLLLYGHIFKNKYRIGNDYFEFLERVPLQNEMIGSFWYQKFLMAYVNHLHMQSVSQEFPYFNQYNLASDQLSGRALAYVQSELIVRAFKAKRMDEIMGKYYEFSQDNPYPEFEDKVVNAFQEAMKHAEGVEAPDFTLTNTNGELVRLGSYRGQVIYLNFWASWCRPCIKKMDAMRDMQRQLENDGVVFVNISLDKDPATWQNTVAAKGISGVNLRITEEDEHLMQTYNVSVLPQYYLIDKSGNFAPKPKKYDLLALKNELENLLQQSAN